MKTTKALAWVVALGGLATSFLSCTQTQAACQVGLAGGGLGYAVKYTLVGSMPACASMPGFTVAQMGDIIGMESYHPPTADGTTYDVHTTTIALQSDTLGNEAATYGYTPPKGQQLFATGTFANENPDSAAQCPVINLQPAIAKLPAVTPMPPDPKNPPLPADGWQYDWSNMKVYVTAADQGVQFAADLTLTETLQDVQGMSTSCAVQYHAIGLWPGISCTDTDGSANEDLCNPCAEPEKGRATGSGISPDALTACVQIFAKDDTRGAYYCVLAGTHDPPVNNPTPPTCAATNGSGAAASSSSSSSGGGGAGGSPGTGGSGTGGAGGGSGDAGTDAADGG